MNQANQSSVFSATGRRKNAVATVTIREGSGKIMVNEKAFDDFFVGLDRQKKEALKALLLLPSANSHDLIIHVYGGGITGQSGAIRLGISRAILKLNSTLKQSLRKEGLLTRDPRMVERKKPGRPKARKRFQYGKR